MSQSYLSLDEDEHDGEVLPCLSGSLLPGTTKPKPRTSPWKSLKTLGGRINTSTEKEETLTPQEKRTKRNTEDKDLPVQKERSSTWGSIKRSLSLTKSRGPSTDSGFTESASPGLLPITDSFGAFSSKDALWTEWREMTSKKSNSSSSSDDDDLLAVQSPPNNMNPMTPRPITPGPIAPARLSTPGQREEVKDSAKSQKPKCNPKIDLTASAQKLQKEKVEKSAPEIPLLRPPPAYRHTIATQPSEARGVHGVGTDDVFRDATSPLKEKPRSKSHSGLVQRMSSCFEKSSAACSGFDVRTEAGSGQRSEVDSTTPGLGQRSAHGLRIHSSPSAPQNLGSVTNLFIIKEDAGRKFLEEDIASPEDEEVRQLMSKSSPQKKLLLKDLAQQKPTQLYDFDISHPRFNLAEPPVKVPAKPAKKKKEDSAHNFLVDKEHKFLNEDISPEDDEVQQPMGKSVKVPAKTSKKAGNKDVKKAAALARFKKNSLHVDEVVLSANVKRCNDLLDLLDDMKKTCAYEAALVSKNFHISLYMYSQNLS